MDSGLLFEARARQAQYFLKLAELAEVQLWGRECVAWLERLDADRDNLRAALQWCVEGGDTQLGLRLAGALARYWMIRGYLVEGQEWFNRFFALPGAGDR